MTKYSVIFIMLFAYVETFAQLSISPNTDFAKCPGEWIIYTVINDNPSGCQYDWEVTNGEIQGGYESNGKWLFTGGNQVSIKWDYSSTSGTIDVEAFSCTGTGTISRNPPILTLTGVTPDPISGPSEVPANNTANRQYTAPQINFVNRGDGDPDPYEVDGYEWELPSGWTIVSGANNKTITVKPDAFTEGAIRVRGKLTQCSAGPFYSNWSAPFPITRTVAQPQAITGNGGKDYVVCGDTDPITFSVSSVTGATSYTWTKPSGWSGSSTSNSITLTPDGQSAGDITVKANSGPYTSSPRSRSLDLENADPDNPPQTIGPSVVCNGAQGTYSLSNVPGGITVSWSTSSNLSIASGQGTSSVTVQASSSGNGNAWVRPTVTTCSDTTLNKKNFWIDRPYTQPDTIEGKSSVVQNAWETYEVDPLDGATSYSWVLPPTWSYYTYTDPTSNEVTLVTGSQSGYVRVKGVNNCGDSNYSSKYVTVSGGGGCGSPVCFSMSPNPATNQFNLEVEDNTPEDQKMRTTTAFSSGVVTRDKYEVVIYNMSHDVKMKGHSLLSKSGFQQVDCARGYT